MASAPASFRPSPTISTFRPSRSSTSRCLRLGLRRGACGPVLDACRRRSALDPLLGVARQELDSEAHRPAACRSCRGHPRRIASSNWNAIGAPLHRSQTRAPSGCPSLGTDKGRRSQAARAGPSISSASRPLPDAPRRPAATGPAPAAAADRAGERMPTGAGELRSGLQVCSRVVAPSGEVRDRRA